jgi:hypothetical protein
MEIVSEYAGETGLLYNLNEHKWRRVLSLLIYVSF